MTTTFEGRKDLSAYAGRVRDGNAAVAHCGAPPRVGCVIAGTQKGGTTALASYLYEHPQVSIPGAKELHFFDAEAPFSGEGVDYAAYHEAFTTTPETHLLCDATPIYMYWDPAPMRIWRYNPAMKWIFVLRDPATRAFSHWNMQRVKQRDPLPFFDALRSETTRCRAALPFQHPWWSYTDRGFYTQQLRRIVRFFPRRQFLLLRSEDLRRSPSRVLAEVAQFLGIASFPAVESRDVYAIAYERAMDTSAHRWLQNAFEYDVRDLERTFGLDCSGWLADPIPGAVSPVDST